MGLGTSYANLGENPLLTIYIQHYSTEIHIDGKTFNCAEQYYMCDQVTARDILISED